MNNIERYNALHTEIMKRLDEGEITTEQAKELNNRFFDKYVAESADESNDKSKSPKAKTYKFRGVNIELGNADSDEKIKYAQEQLQKCKSVLGKFNKIEDEIFNKYYDIAIKNWDMDYVKNKNDLKKLAKLDYVEFYVYKDNKYDDARFNIVYNGKSQNEKFFGGHSLCIRINIKNNKIEDYEGVLEG